MTMVDQLFAFCRSSAVRSAKRVGEPSGSTYCLGAHMMEIETSGMPGGQEALESALAMGPRSLWVRVPGDKGTSAAGLVVLTARVERALGHGRALCEVAGR